jgi:hypothetical protein
MAITDPLLLPADVILARVAELRPDVRERISCHEEDYAITRPRSRTPSKIVDSAAAELLKAFRSPKTITDAVIEYNGARNRDPEQILEAVFPLLRELIEARFLIPSGGANAEGITASWTSGDRVAGFEIIERIQVVEDTEVYRVRLDASCAAALKITRPGVSPRVRRAFEREELILRGVEGSVAPRLLEAGTFEDRSYLAVEWLPGIPCDVAAARLRKSPSRDQLLDLCHAILCAYADLHSRGVIHSDVHPRNVLFQDDGSVKLVDFGLARIEGASDLTGRVHRGGIGFFFEPEYASACLRGQPAPQSTFQGEQYALAALLYFLLTRAHYLDFSFEKSDMMRQIAEDAPLPFARRNILPWPDVETALGTALRKLPGERFPSVAELGRAIRTAATANKQQCPTLVESAATRLLDRVLARLALEGPMMRTGVRGLQSAR